MFSVSYKKGVGLEVALTQNLKTDMSTAPRLLPVVHESRASTPALRRIHWITDPTLMFRF